MRKLLGNALLLVLFSIVGCCYNADNALREIDVLSESYPDSALKRLEEWHGSNKMSGAQEKYYNLLVVKAHDKSYHEPIAGSDSLIRDIIEYFESHRVADSLKSMALYYGGRVNHEFGDYPQAIEYYISAFEIEPSPHKRNLIATQLGDIYESLGFYDQGCKWFKVALGEALLGEEDNKAPEYLNLSKIYEKMGMMDSAEYYGRRGLENAEQFCDSMWIIQVKYALMRAAIYDKDYMRAALYMPEISKYSGTRMMRDSLTFSVWASSYYHGIGNDSMANLHCNRLMSSDNAENREFGWYCNSILQNAKGETTAAQESLNRYFELNDSSRRSESELQVARLAASYDYTLKEKRLRRAQEEKSRVTIILLFVGVVGVVLVAIVVLCNIRLHNHKVRTALRNRELETILERLLSSSDRPTVGAGNDVVVRGKYEVDVSDVLQEELARIVEHNGGKVSIDVPDIVGESGIIKIIQRHLDDSTSLSAGDWERMEEVVNIAYPSYVRGLGNVVLLSAIECKVCLLIKLGINPSAIAKLVHRTPTSVTAIRRRLYEKVFHKKGTPALWDQFINSL